MFRKTLLFGLLATMILLPGCKKHAEQARAEAEINSVTLPVKVPVPPTFTWVEIAQDKRITTWLDTRNIAKQEDGRTRYWTRVGHRSALNLGAYRNIAFEVQVRDVDCTTGATTFIYWIALANDGKIIAEKPMNDLKGAPESGSTQDTALNKVCRGGRK